MVNGPLASQRRTTLPGQESHWDVRDCPSRKPAHPGNLLPLQATHPPMAENQLLSRGTPTAGKTTGNQKTECAWRKSIWPYRKINPNRKNQLQTEALSRKRIKKTPKKT